MPKLERSFIIDSSPEKVFEHVSDHRLEVKWNPAMLSVTLETPGAIRPGSVFRVKARQFGEFEIRVLRYEPPSLVSAVADMRPMRSTWTYKVEPTDGRTRLHHTTEIEAHGLMKLLGPVVGAVGKRQFDVQFARLKALLEST